MAKKRRPAGPRAGTKAPAARKRTAAKRKKPARTTRARPKPKRDRPTPRAADATADPDDRFRATPAGCLDQEVATELVFSCIPNGAVPPETLLGTLFGDAARRGFCGCVFAKATAAGATIGTGDIPCAAANTVADVIGAISC
jgi:hypothetical protein